MNDEGGTGHGWTVVLRRRPARITEGRPEGGYTEEFEIVCCYCGDDPDLDYREVSPQLQQIRGPYPIAAGIAAYAKHAGRHPGPQRTQQPGSLVRDAMAAHRSRLIRQRLRAAGAELDEQPCSAGRDGSPRPGAG